MPSLYLLIPIALSFTLLAIGVFIWAVDNQQFDDLESEAYRILFDDVEASQKNASTIKNLANSALKPARTETDSTGDDHA